MARIPRDQSQLGQPEDANGRLGFKTRRNASSELWSKPFAYGHVPVPRPSLVHAAHRPAHGLRRLGAWTSWQRDQLHRLRRQPHSLHHPGGPHPSVPGSRIHCRDPHASGPGLCIRQARLAPERCERHCAAAEPPGARPTDQVLMGQGQGRRSGARASAISGELCDPRRRKTNR
jgi:hypothetical protein